MKHLLLSLVTIFQFVTLSQAQGSQSFNFQVKVRDVKGDIQGAMVEVVLSNNTISRGVTDDNGIATLALTSYRKEPLTIRATVPGYKQKELRNVIAEAYSLYEFILVKGDGLEFEEYKLPPPPAVAVTPSGNVSKKEVKRRKKEAKKEYAREQAYRKELELIRQDQAKNESTRGRLNQQLSELQSERSKGTIKEDAAKKKQDELENELKKTAEEDKKISERLRALDAKYKKI